MVHVCDVNKYNMEVIVMEKKVCKDGRIMLSWKTKDDIRTAILL